MTPFIHIIDDNEAVRESLICLLESEQLPVKAYGSAQEFLDGALPADGCLLTDVQMPGISGLELLRRLRAQGSEAPVIVMTARADPAMAAEAARYDAMFLEKPFEPDTLVAAVREILR